VIRFESYLRGEPGFRGVALCVALLVIVAAMDFATGNELNISLLYLAPVFIAAWIFGGQAGVMVSVIAAVLWYLSVMFTSPAYSNKMYQIWEATIEFATFAIFALVIAKLKTALSQADERFATVLEGFDVAVYVLDAASGELLYANEPFRKTFAGGREPPYLPPGQREGEVHEARRGRWFLVHVRPLRWIDGRTARLHIATDITERRRSEEFYLQQQEKLALTARLVAVGEMATTLAHELNQPLAAIANYNMGCAQRLRSGNWEASELLEAMEKGAAQAERASSVIQRLREFVARRQPKLVACDINDVVRGVRSAIEAEAGKHSVRLVLALSEHISYARADETLMEQVILNLARNAIEAMEDTPAEERELCISSCDGAEETIEVGVADHGRGIDPQLEANLFSPFFSTKPDGMGLGLHISRSIVEAHGGHLWITRNGERGVVFHFSLQSVYA
jgi:C4-dicarboxylate-specific signal transduction histidine kinase